MTQEEKQLLMKDLCTRLPYGVKCNALLKQIDGSFKSVFGIFKGYGGWATVGNNLVDIETVKPYLRPMSSMTEEEKEELKEISDEYLDKWMSVNDPSVRCELDAKISSKRAEFYNSHYLDWNGLIESDLALEASENMYKI